MKCNEDNHIKQEDASLTFCSFNKLVIASIIAIQSGCWVPYGPIRWPAEVEPTRFALLDALQDHAILVLSYDIAVENDVWDFAKTFDIAYYYSAKLRFKNNEKSCRVIKDTVE